MEGLNIHLCVHASLIAIHTSTEIWASLAFSYTLKHQQKHIVGNSHRIHVWNIYSTYIYHENQPKVGKYSIHGAYIWELLFDFFFCDVNIYLISATHPTFFTNVWSILKLASIQWWWLKSTWLGYILQRHSGLSLKDVVSTVNNEVHPGRLTTKTYRHHRFRKENDLNHNQTSMVIFQPFIFRVVAT